MPCTWAKAFNLLKRIAGVITSSSHCCKEEILGDNFTEENPLKNYEQRTCKMSDLKWPKPRIRPKLTHSAVNI